MSRCLFLLVGFCCMMPCWAQRVVSLAESFTIKPYTEGKIECLFPQDQTGRQSILSVQYTRPPDDTILKHGGLYAVWKITRSQETQRIGVVTTMRLTENSLRKASRGLEMNLQKEDLSVYLQPEEMIQSDDNKIGEVAALLRGENCLETIRNVFDYTKDHLEYKIFYNQRQGAKKALRKKRGDCTEYTELMVAILRNLGIPAREATGHTIHNNVEKRIGYHSWVEAHTDESGWISFDPTWADHEKSFTTYERMENAYILLGYGHSATRNRSKVTGGDFQVDYKSGWEDPTNLIDRRVQRALFDDSIPQAHESLDTLLFWLPNKSEYIGYRATAFMREGKFKEALPLIQLSFVQADHPFRKEQCMRNMAAYMANTGKKKEAMQLLLTLEKESEITAATISGNRLFSPLNNRKDFQQLQARGEALNKQMFEESKARKRGGKGN